MARHPICEDTRETYQREVTRFDDLLKRLDAAMRDRLPAPDDDENPLCWGHIGELLHLNHLMEQIIRQLEGRN